MITKTPVDSCDAIDNIDNVSDNLNALSELFLVMNDSDFTQIEKSFGFLSELMMQQHEILDEAVKILCSYEITKRKSE